MLICFGELIREQSYPHGRDPLTLFACAKSSSTADEFPLWCFGAEALASSYTPDQRGNFAVVSIWLAVAVAVDLIHLANSYMQALVLDHLSLSLLPSSFGPRCTDCSYATLRVHLGRAHTIMSYEGDM